jgi:hypothetical protein
LGFTFGLLFLVALIGQAIAGHADFNNHQIANGAQTVSFIQFIASSEFVVDVAENWQSEYLQFFLYIFATVWLIQRGSPESKEPREVTSSVEQVPDHEVRRIEHRLPGLLGVIERVEAVLPIRHVDHPHVRAGRAGPGQEPVDHRLPLGQFPANPGQQQRPPRRHRLGRRVSVGRDPHRVGQRQAAQPVRRLGKPPRADRSPDKQASPAAERGTGRAPAPHDHHSGQPQVDTLRPVNIETGVPAH